MNTCSLQIKLPQLPASVVIPVRFPLAHACACKTCVFCELPPRGVRESPYPITDGWVRVQTGLFERHPDFFISHKCRGSAAR
jgi:hypothetical protein